MSLIDRDFKLNSGERVTAVAIDDIPPDHWARYEFARDCLIEMNATRPLIGADIFCGAGYGTQFLAQTLPCHILGIDGSAEAIERASRQYANLNLFFSHKFFPFSLPPEHFDFIVSMESIEHVEDGELFFNVLEQALKPGGRLIISAPNSEVVDLGKNPYAWHYRHYTRQEIENMGRNARLRHIKCVGAECTVIDASGKVVSGNYFSPKSGALRQDHAGDTLTHLFVKD